MTASTPAPLSGITVIDLSRILAGPYCTMMLAELGARIIKVETPEGDDARRIGPFIKDRSAYFMSLNRGKESIVLDLREEDDRHILHKLLGKADVLVENFRPSTMEKLGLGWETLHQRHPRLIYAGNVKAYRGAHHHANLLHYLPDAEVFLVGRTREPLV